MVYLYTCYLILKFDINVLMSNKIKFSLLLETFTLNISDTIHYKQSSIVKVKKI